MQMTAPLAQASTEEKTIMVNIVKREIAAQQRSKRDHITATEEELKQKTKRLNGMLARDLKAREMVVRPCLADRICDGVINAYAVVYATIYTIANLLVQCEDD